MLLRCILAILASLGALFGIRCAPPEPVAEPERTPPVSVVQLVGYGTECTTAGAQALAMQAAVQVQVECLQLREGLRWIAPGTVAE